MKRSIHISMSFIVTLVMCTMGYAQEVKAVDEYQQQADTYWTEADTLKAEHQYARAAELYELGIKEEKTGTAPRPEQLAAKLNALGMCYEQGSAYTKTHDMHQEALRYAQHADLPDEVAAAHIGMGNAYREWGQYEAALEHFTAALELSRQMDDSVRIARASNKIAEIYIDQGKYKDAEEALKPAIDTPDDMERAIANNELGRIAFARGYYPKSVKYHKESLDIAKTLEKDYRLAVYYNNLGMAYLKQAEYKNAKEALELALTNAEEFKRRDYIASINNSIGGLHFDQSQFKEALEYFEKSLKVDEELGRKAKLATRKNNVCALYMFAGDLLKVATCMEEVEKLNKEVQSDLHTAVEHNQKGSLYYGQGEYDKALEHFQQAYTLFNNMERNDDAGTVLNNIGMIYYSWGQYDEAYDYFTRASDLFKELDVKVKIARTNIGLGLVYTVRSEYDLAITTFQKALTIFSELEKKMEMITCHNNIGMVFLTQKDDVLALESFHKALELATELDVKSQIVTIKTNIGHVYSIRHDFSQAMKFFGEAMELAQELERKAEISILHAQLGTTYMDQLQFPEAIAQFENAITLTEELRETATDEVRRDYLARVIGHYQSLANCYIETGAIEQALATIEQSRARFLAEQLTETLKVDTPSIESIQTNLADDTAILFYADAGKVGFAQFIITHDYYGVSRHARSTFVQKIKERYGAVIDRMIYRAEKLETALESYEGLTVYGYEPSNEFEQIVEYYYNLLMEPAATRGFERLHADRGWRIDEIREELSKNLYTFFFYEDVQNVLQDKTRLIIVPDGILNFLPFETLLDAQGHYLSERYTISYVQSLGILGFLQQREYAPSRKPILAFGGAEYEVTTEEARQIENMVQLAYHKRGVYENLSRGASVYNSYAPLGRGIWKNLPGTQAEVESIQQLISGAEILTGADVAEETVKAFSHEGRLAQYEILHFATHGTAKPEIPELSALVLTLIPEAQDANEGYLTVNEIAELHINADFVNLSACETGLGKVYSGEGVVGLTQAFLLAGANGLSVSLWQVADKSTAQFMIALYELVEEQGLSYAEAITEVKRRFIAGDFGEKWKVPYYWAPFVYYGRY